MKRLLAFLFVTTLLFSCSKEDENPTLQLESRILGQWDVQSLTYTSLYEGDTGTLFFDYENEIHPEPYLHSFEFFEDGLAYEHYHDLVYRFEYDVIGENSIHWVHIENREISDELGIEFISEDLAIIWKNYISSFDEDITEEYTVKRRPQTQP